MVICINGELVAVITDAESVLCIVYVAELSLLLNVMSSTLNVEGMTASSNSMVKVLLLKLISNPITSGGLLSEMILPACAVSAEKLSVGSMMGLPETSAAKVVVKDTQQIYLTVQRVVSAFSKSRSFLFNIISRELPVILAEPPVSINEAVKPASGVF